jgi:hypothetical protein
MRVLLRERGSLQMIAGACERAGAEVEETATGRTLMHPASKA